MKKYFIAETDDEIQVGETLELDFTKEVKHGRIKTTKDVTLNEINLPWLLKTGIIEEREVEEEENNTPENGLLDFGDETPCDALEALEEDFEKLEEKVERLETIAVGVCKEMITLIKELLKEDKEDKKNAQPKKK